MILPATRLEAIAYYRRALDKAATAGLLDEVERELALGDLFYLLTVVLGRKDLNHDWLFARCREVQAAPNGYLDLWGREHGKAQALDTPTLTHNRGWVRHGELRIGDLVYNDQGCPVAVLATSPVWPDEACREVTFSCGARLVVSARHLWRVRQKHRLRVGDWRTSDRRIITWSEEIVPTDLLPARADVGVLAEPIVGVPHQLVIDPYVLGVWLGDGTVGGTCITSALSDADEMESTLRARGALVARARHSNSVSLRIGSGRRGDRSSSDFANGLRKIGVYKSKHIPRCYLEASAHQRMMLLRGLMDTDGTCNTRGTATFTSAIERLAKDFLELATGLALRPRFRRYSHNVGPYKGHVFYQVNFQAHQDRNPFLMARKAARAISSSAHRDCRDVVAVVDVPSVPTKCIQVEGGIYLTGRELIPTHNSSLITFGLTIKDILNNPETTVGIFSFSRPIAKAFLRQIKREFEANEKLRSLFPDVLWSSPHRDAPKWSEDEGITVRRKGNPKEATIEAWGLVDAQPTSKHFSLMVYDDVVTKDSVTTPDMIRKVTESWEASLNLSAQGGAIRIIGTRWHTNDTYRQIIDRGAAKERRHPVTVDGTVEGEPVLWSRELVAQKRRDMGPYVFGAQMLLDPAMDKVQGFKYDWLRYYTGESDFSRMNKYILVDAANSKRKGSDFTAIGVIGLADDDNYYLLDLVRDRLSLPERTEALFEMHRRWKPMKVGYERYGMMADVAHIQDRQRRENYRFELVELGGPMAKVERIRQLIPLFEGGRFHLPEAMMKVDYEGKRVDLVHAFIHDEYLDFPVAQHDDVLDMLARIVDPALGAVWPKPKPVSDRYALPRRRVAPRSFMVA